MANHKKAFKTCAGCRMLLPRDVFYSLKAGTTHNYCRPCAVQRVLQARKDNTPQYTAYMREYRQTPAGRQAIRRYEDSPKGVAARARRNLRRRTRKRGILITLTAMEWQAILEQYDNRCAYCGATGRLLTIDHKIPISRGGHHTKENVVPACRPCNSRKKDRLL